MRDAETLKIAKEYCDEQESEVLAAAKHVLEALEQYENALAKGDDVTRVFEDFDINKIYDLEYAYERIILDVFFKKGIWFVEEFEHNPKCALVLSKLTDEDPDLSYFGDYDYNLMSIWVDGIVDEFTLCSKPYSLENIEALREALQKAMKAYANSNEDSPLDKMMKLFDITAIAYTASDVLRLLALESNCTRFSNL